VIDMREFRLGQREEARYPPPNPSFKTWNRCPGRRSLGLNDDRRGQYAAEGERFDLQLGIERATPSHTSRGVRRITGVRSSLASDRRCPRPGRA
jgi:hypothetical protein